MNKAQRRSEFRRRWWWRGRWVLPLYWLSFRHRRQRQAENRRWRSENWLKGNE